MKLIDLPALLQRYEGKQDFVDRLLTTAWRSNLETAEKLRMAAEAKDMEGLAFLAHTLKGMSGNLVLNELFMLAKEAELAARGERDDAILLAGDLADKVDRLLNEIAERGLAKNG